MTLASLVRAGYLAVATLAASACTMVGPDYERPPSPLMPDWYQAERASLEASPLGDGRWWERFQDPALNRLIEAAHRENNNLKVAALRILESRAQLGIAVGQRYPQTQVAAGSATAVQASKSGANTAAGDLRFTQYDLGASVSWEADFWGRYARGIEAADAAFQASIAAYDDVLVLLTASVADLYVLIRTAEEQLRITRENVAIQTRSLEIADVQYRNGATSELDVLQARTLLQSTRATVPAIEAALAQAQHALSTLLGRAPGDIPELRASGSVIPVIPDELVAGVPADLLRRRPDVRQAELQAFAQNANVGLAEANLYPSFTLSGTVGLSAAGGTNTSRSGDEGLGALFNSDSLTYTAGPAFVWPFLNYGRLRNGVRVQDARLQQALVRYTDTVLSAAREVEDAMVQLRSFRQQDVLLAATVEAARRSNEVATLRYTEGFASYQRVLDAQQALFVQQGRYVDTRGEVVRSVIALYLALGGGWEVRRDGDLIDEAVTEQMEQRTNWGELIDDTEAAATAAPAEPPAATQTTPK